ncbi:hypothetical protein [Streptomyces canus]|uniref:hypothetical protein n=1 Tax=Streptomyces canus TaxID=58343 RepID=UPI003864F19E|nr:hypothetical protein OH824_17835 [Streptomyces canus]
MAFRKSVSQDELRESMSPERREQQATVYQASRGGHYPAEARPTPGTPQDGSREN